jgi:8-oxo-dGTP diphosphatase
VGEPQVAIGAIIVHDGSLLMVRRAHDPGKGLWSLPGGRVEAGELLTDALAREVSEEAGLEIEIGALAGIFEVPGPEVHYVILDYHAQVTGDPEPRAGGDASEVRWVPLGEVMALDCTPRFVETMKTWGVLPSADDE